MTLCNEENTATGVVSQKLSRIKMSSATTSYLQEFIINSTLNPVMKPTHAAEPCNEDT